MKNFALIGAAGFVAPRHMKAIKETGNRLVCALDPHDSVGILDSYFPESAFFTEFERFDRYVDKIRHNPIDYVSICSPNYLHDAHIRWALRSGADAICEKPLVLNPWNVEALERFEREHQRKVWNILQLRLHPAIVELKAKLEAEGNTDKKAEISLTYIAPRGAWYQHSWKGDNSKSGSIITNIGIHFFDLLLWLFGPVSESRVHLHEATKAEGFLELERANVKWYLSVDAKDMRNLNLGSDQPAPDLNIGYRSLIIDSKELSLDKGFTDLHTKSYSEILAGRGFGIQEALPSIDLVHRIRSSKISGKI